MGKNRKIRIAESTHTHTPNHVYGIRIERIRSNAFSYATAPNLARHGHNFQWPGLSGTISVSKDAVQSKKKKKNATYACDH